MSKNTNFVPYDARSLAIYTINCVQNGDAIQAALNKSIVKYNLNSLENSLCTEICYGYLRYCLRIDAILRRFLSKPHKLPSILKINLGIAIYSIIFLNKIPHHASVNWSVEFAKKVFGISLSKVCNGVLRNVLRNINDFNSPEFYEISDYYSVPKWLYTLLVTSYGKQNAHDIFERSLQRPQLSIRLNKSHELYSNLDNFFSEIPGIQKNGFSGYAFVHEDLPKAYENLSISQLHCMGAFTWQSLASQVAMYHCFAAIPELSSEIWWDACAGQGGKSLMLLEQGVKIKFASDISLQRLNQLSINAQRLNVLCPIRIIMSAANPSFRSFNGSFILDVPCSGVGTLGKRPDIRLHRTISDVHHLVSLQRQILNSIWNVLPTKKFIIYQTCTLNPDENENQIFSFLNAHSDSELLYTWQTPHDNTYLEGMYICVLKKK